MPVAIPNVLSIAGSDPSGGAGIQADLKTFAALRVYGMAAISGLTAQNTRGVSAIQPLPAAFVAAQIDAVFEDIRVDAVKLGMLGGADVVAAVADCLRRWRPPVVVLDPVMVAKSGAALLAESAVECLRRQLLPLATVITPNLPEAGALLDAPPPADLPAMREAARALHALGPAWVLLKGGHLPGEDCTDLLYDGREFVEFPGRRIATAQHARHRLHAVGGHRGRTRARPGDAAGGGRRQGLSDRRHCRRGFPRCRPRSRPGATLSRLAGLTPRARRCRPRFFRMPRSFAAPGKRRFATARCAVAKERKLDALRAITEWITCVLDAICVMQIALHERLSLH